MFFCSFVFLCVTSSVSFTGFYNEDEVSGASVGPQPVRDPLLCKDCTSKYR